MKRTTVKIPEELDARLRKEAELRDTTVSALVREAIEQFLPHRNGPDGRRRLSFTGMFASGYTDTAERAEEILRSAFRERDPHS